jgi:hypothetical protein
MHRTNLLGAWLAALFALTGQVQAGLISTGNLFDVLDDTGTRIASTVDH